MVRVVLRVPVVVRSGVLSVLAHVVVEGSLGRVAEEGVPRPCGVAEVGVVLQGFTAGSIDHEHGFALSGSPAGGDLDDGGGHVPEGAQVPVQLSVCGHVRAIELRDEVLEEARACPQVDAFVEDPAVARGRAAVRGKAACGTSVAL